ncbi:MAG: hypothetical protein ACREWI_18445, partial [Telluria sp.]
FAYILYSVARGLGINVFFFAQIQVRDSFIIARSIEDMFAPIRTEYQRLRESGGPVALSGRVKIEFDRRSDRQKPFYTGVSDLKWSRKIYEWNKLAFRIDTRLRVHRLLRNVLAYWRARKPMPPAGAPFVYFPLHLQPEASTSAMGGVFVDQYFAVELLARALPDGWTLVVKEHPAQYFAKREYGFYKRIGRIKNVRLVSRSIDTYALIDQCRAVASITGTAGWEALFTDKPVLVLGNAIYRGAPGTVSVDDPAELAARLAEIAQGEYPRRSSEDLERFLAAIGQCSHEGVVDTVYLRDSDLTVQRAIETQAAALMRLVESPQSVR